MAQYIEQWLPGIKENGLNTLQATTLGSTVSATSTVTSASGYIGLSATTNVSGGYSEALIKGGLGLFGIYFGSGAPTISAGQGSLYANVTASATTQRLYINTTGATAWAAFTALA